MYAKHFMTVNGRDFALALFRLIVPAVPCCDGAVRELHSALLKESLAHTHILPQIDYLWNMHVFPLQFICVCLYFIVKLST